MSRSRRKTPVRGVTTAKSDKPYKTTEHKRERRFVKISLQADKDPPAVKAFGNPWSSRKDGKYRFGTGSPELLRK